MKLIFVSCGQGSEEERQVGEAVCNAINGTHGFRAFFAQQVQSLDALTGPIFRALKECSGMVALLQPRGRVQTAEGAPEIIRSSVWVNQEIAILAYRFAIHNQPVQILAFKADEVELEGALKWLITNPERLESLERIIERVKKWLGDTSFPPGQEASIAVFRGKWNRLSSGARITIKVIVEEGGIAVKVQAVKEALRERHRLVAKNEASEIVRTACAEFIQTDLVKIIPNHHSGDELTINPTWKDAIAGVLEEGDFECHMTDHTKRITWEGDRAHVWLDCSIGLINKSPRSVIIKDVFVEFEWNETKRRGKVVQTTPELPQTIAGNNGSGRLGTKTMLDTSWKRGELPPKHLVARYSIQTADGAEIVVQGEPIQIQLG